MQLVFVVFTMQLVRNLFEFVCTIVRHLRHVLRAKHDLRLVVPIVFRLFELLRAGRDPGIVSVVPAAGRMR